MAKKLSLDEKQARVPALGLENLPVSELSRLAALGKTTCVSHSRQTLRASRCRVPNILIQPISMCVCNSLDHRRIRFTCIFVW